MAALRIFNKIAQRSLPSLVVSRSTHLIARRYAAARMFSTSKQSVNAELAEALKQEISAEKQLEADNLGGAVAPGIPGFKISANDAEVRLTKTHGNEKILVVFNVNHSVDMEDDYIEEGQQEQEPPVPVALPPFSVEITKGNERLCFHMELVEAEDEEGQYDFRVEEFYVAPAAKGEDEEVEASVYASSGKYIDPNLHELLFVRYLEERGIDAKFCQNLVAYATHYEHSRYVALLDRIKAFVAN